MGELINGWLIFIGILPMPGFDKVPALKGIKIEGKTNYEKLEDLMNNEIFVNDNHHGYIKGKLISLNNTDNYSILTDKGVKYLKVHDLESIF
jgi:hypothetical protein